MFFGWLIKEVSCRPNGKPMFGEARALMMQWLAFDDPLRISEDPECGYGRPAGFVMFSRGASGRASARPSQL